MRTYLDCYPCFLRQTLEAARMAGADERQQRRALERVLDLLRQVDPASTPPQIGDQVHRVVRQEVRDGDPYRAVKESSTQQALALYPRLQALMAQADEPLEVGIRLSIAGNIIDLGPNRKYDLWDTVQRVLTQPFAIDDGATFRDALGRAGQVLYLADNAGETVFDMLLIEALEMPVIYAVKGGPTLNDATRDDALAAGLDRVADIVSTGSDAPGTILDRCSEEFRRLYSEADVVIAKGQGNYETLSEEGAKVFLLLQAKCPVIARDLGVSVGSIVLKQGISIKPYHQEESK
jgi:uncharacterized protein with ATP-grasp and redox domains